MSFQTIQRNKIENVFIPVYGKADKISADPVRDQVEIAESLFGVLPQTMTIEEVREERMNEA